MSSSFGLNQTFEYTELNLDSWDATATAGDATDILSKYSWPLYYFTSRDENVAAYKVLEASIPFVFYTINSTNNTFIFTQGINYTITIPPGTYTGTSLATAVQTLIVPLSAGFTVTYSTTTLLYTFTHNIAGAWGISFPTRDTPYSFLGFLPTTTYSNTGVSSIVSVMAAQPVGPTYIYVNSRKLGPFTNFNLSDGAPSGGDFPGLCRIPINAAYGSTILYKDADPEKYFDLFLGHQFDTFDFYLTLGSDQSQVPLDMRGVSWSLKLGILTYRQATGDLMAKPKKNGSTIIQG